MNFSQKIFTYIYEKSSENVARFGAQYDAFSIFIFVFYLANPLKWQFNGPYSFSIIFFLRLTATILWFLLLCWRVWPQSLRPCLPLFWHFSLLYHLPFRTTFSLLYARHSPSFDSFGLLGIVALALLVDDRAFCLLSILGFLLGCCVYFSFGGFDISYVNGVTLAYAALMVITIAFIKFIFMRNHNMSLTEKIKANKIFAGAIAHELRTPISAILISSENRDFTTIRRQAKRALGIVDSVLQQIKYMESARKIHCTPQPLTQLIYEACEDVYFSEQERQKIQLQITDNYWVQADHILLRQIIINLLKNALWAVRASPNGLVKIAAQKRQEYLHISFIDTGTGIVQKHKKYLFEPFYSSSKNGTGIGLAFCKLALKNMGGSIKYYRDGESTCFTIHLKCVRETDEGTSNEPTTYLPIPYHDLNSR